MNKYDMVLVNPHVYAPKTTLAPFGLVSIATFLDRHGYRIRIIDLQLEAPKKLFDELKSLREDGVVGFGGASEGRFQVYEYSKKIKSLMPDVTTVYGGPHATFTGELILDRKPAIDIIVHHEGELTVLELMGALIDKKISINQIDGISFRENGKIIRTKNRTRIKELDMLEYDYQQFIDLNNYDQSLFFGLGKASHFLTSRGCFATCNFCAATSLWQNRITCHSPQRVLEELEKIFKIIPALNGIIFADSLLTFSRNHVLGLCREIKNRNLDFLWSCDVRANSVDYEMLSEMKSAGCYSVNFGFESASQRVLQDAIKKRVRLKDAENLFDWVTELDMHTIINVTWGHPTETLEEARHTLEYVMRIQSDHIHVLDPQPMRIYPGTPLETFAVENNLFPKGFDWCTDYNDDPGLRRSTPYVPILFQPQLGLEEFKRLEEEYFSMPRPGMPVFAKRSV